MGAHGFTLGGICQPPMMNTDIYTCLGGVDSDAETSARIYAGDFFD